MGRQRMILSRHDALSRAVHRHAISSDRVGVAGVPLRARRAQPVNDGPPWVEEMRSRLYAQPVPRSFANHPTNATVEHEQLRVQRPVEPAAPTRVQASQLQLDVGRLSDEVYRHIERKIRIERERRGL
jgi:hypothetical protein